MNKALVVVDMQNDFVTGSLANRSAQEIIPGIKDLINSGDYNCVIFTLDTHYDNYLETPEGKKLPIEHCISGKKGWEIVPEFQEELDSEEIPFISTIWKTNFGTFQLAEHLEGCGQIDEVTFCGTCTDICVVSNALILKAMRPNWIINVKADCCAGLTPEKHKAALEVMDSCQINII